MIIQFDDQFKSFPKEEHELHVKKTSERNEKG